MLMTMAENTGAFLLELEKTSLKKPPFRVVFLYQIQMVV